MDSKKSRTAAMVDRTTVTINPLLPCNKSEEEGRSCGGGGGRWGLKKKEEEVSMVMEEE